MVFFSYSQKKFFLIILVGFGVFIGWKEKVFFPALAATDITVSVTCSGGSCTTPPGPGGGGEIYPTTTPPLVLEGCTDSQALNYDPKAKKDDGTCTYGDIPNVGRFVATFSTTHKEVFLSWQNPNYSKFLSVRVIRSSRGIPENPNDGVVIYEGTGESVVDQGVELDVSYFYAAFVRSEDDGFSSGALATAYRGTRKPPTEPTPTTTPTTTLPIIDNGGLTDDQTNPFASLPQVESRDPLIVSLGLGDFLAYQSGRLPQAFDIGQIKLNARLDTVFEVRADKLPKSLKTIGLVLTDPKDSRQTFSFLLRINKAGTAYTATIGPLEMPGSYPAKIYLINYDDQSIKTLHSVLVVSRSSLDFLSSAQNFDGGAVTPLVISGGLLAGLVQVAVVAGKASSAYDFYLLLVRGVYALLGWLGIRKRREPWGTVYDSVTKRPLDPVYVTVEKDGKEAGSAITDIDGRYGFLLPPATYLVKAGKTHYRFPSQSLVGRQSDELYDNLYFGQPINYQGTEVLNLNIPMDPLEFDWNEFAKTKTNFFQIYSKKETWRKRIIGTVFYSGFILSALKSIFYPAWWDLVLLLIYILIYSFQTYWQVTHPVVAVKRQATGEPLPFALVRLFMSGVNQQIKAVSTDQLGRVYLLVRPGNYYLTIEEKMPDGSYQKVYQSPEFELKKGVLAQDILV